MMEARFELAPGVTLGAATLIDSSTRRLIMLSPEEITVVGGRAGASDSLDPEAWRTVEALHGLGMVNVRYPLRAWLRAAWQLARYGDTCLSWRMATQRRVEISGTAFTTIALQVLRALALRHAYLVGLCLALALGITFLAGSSVALIVPLSAVPPAIVILGIALHESGHLYVLRRVCRQADAGWLCVGALGASVRRDRLPPRQALVVAVAGPLGPAVLGVLACVLGLWVEIWAFFVVGVSLALHLACLAPWATDGKNALSALWASRPCRRELRA